MFERLKVKTNPPRPPYAGTAKEKSTLNVSCLKAAVRQTYLPALGEMHPGTRTESGAGGGHPKGTGPPVKESWAMPLPTWMRPLRQPPES
ncbi:MAG: hypothetical protein ICV82_02740 [Nitrososphaera sp.]|nr:hypothetical protein [Nitrososphaera sp.]